MFTGSFRLVAGSQHLHWRYSFTGSLVETAAKSLRHSCRSELTRQGISLRLVTFFLKERVSRFGSAHLCMSPCSSDHIILQLVRLEIRRMASEDSEICSQAFLLVVCTDRIVTHLL